MINTRSILPWLVLSIAVAWIAWQQAQPAVAQSVGPAREQVAIFSFCAQAPDAAKSVADKSNTWLSDHRTARILAREMYTSPCPGVTEYGSVAVTLAIHYQPDLTDRR